MPRRIRAKLSFANVISVIALFVALGGSAYGAGLFTGKDIEDGSITGDDLAPITGKDLAANTLTGREVKEGRLKNIDECQSGTPIDIGDICVGPIQPAATWQTALSACISVNLRLPSISEGSLVIAAAQQKNTAYLWTSDFVDAGPPSTRAIIRSTPYPLVAVRDETQTAQFRCVSSPKPKIPAGREDSSSSGKGGSKK
jgi:hypothetical protein